jgi:uncharacterized protein (TIGR03083 family)
VTSVERSRYLDALATESAAFADAVASCPLSAPVPSCPDWTVEDLVFHLGAVHRFWGEVVSRRLTSPGEVEEPPRPGPDQIVAWAGEQAAGLRAVLEEADPATPVWTWAPQQDVAFVVRRMAHETAVHRWDAQRAGGTPMPIDPELASDGIDEFLTVMLTHPRFAASSIGGSVHVHATDTPGEWLVKPADDGSIAVTAEHAKGDAAVRGPASDLLLALWRRVGLDDVEVIGDRSVAEHFVAHTTMA